MDNLLTRALKLHERKPVARWKPQVQFRERNLLRSASRKKAFSVHRSFHELLAHLINFFSIEM